MVETSSSWAEDARTPKPPIEKDQRFAQGVQPPLARPDLSASKSNAENWGEIPLPAPAPKIGTAAVAPQLANDKALNTGDTCLAKLQALAEAQRVSSTKADNAACAIPDPVQLIKTKGSFAITLSGSPTLDCPMALAFADFSRNVVQPLAGHHMGSSVTTIVTGPGFSCRRRNRAATGKLSEHAFGNGVDVTGFIFENGKRFAVGSGAKLTADQARFQAALRRSACGWFTTILGPGSDAAHAHHLHFDLGRMKNLKPGREPYRICN
ncbi:MAG: extensin family protein [Pseudomonadota bacterium]